MASNFAESFSYGQSPLFLFADHASNAIPSGFENLGVSNQELATHIGWDIGAEAVSRMLAKQLNATLLCCRFSRLLIDPNRTLDNPALIPETSDNIIIPGNQGLSAQARQNRIDTFYRPYHKRLRDELDRFQALHKDPLVVSVHSFTEKLSQPSKPRPWHISLLWKDDEESARTMMETLRADTNYIIGDNVPYSGHVYNDTVDQHVGPRGLRHLTFEIRQDLISSEDGVAEIANAIGPALGKLL